MFTFIFIFIFLSPLGERLGEGNVAEHLLDLCPNALRILNDLVRPEAHHAPTFALYRRCPARIRLDLESMVIAIDLDHQQAKSAK